MMDKATELLRRGKLGQATSLLRDGLRADPVDLGQGGRPSPARPAETGFGDTASRFKTGFESPRSVPPSAPRNGRFIDGSLDAGGGYKLYVPAAADEGRRPLVVLLHGCTQDPDDFAAGTGMNERAEAEGTFVLYPTQTAAANHSRCWNWFRPEDQQRGRGEPAQIAAITKAVIDAHDIDPDRVYIAGLSAGGAMAAIVASKYPELFAAVGVHSGLPDGAARNLPDALAAMRTGSTRGRANGDASGSSTRMPPTIVFHGDQDRTVHPSNGRAVVEAALRDAGPVTERTVDAPAQGRSKPFTRSEYLDAAGRTAVESWIVHGGGHAWAGGHIEGRYTDPEAPSASDAMLRFFLAHRRSSAA